MSFDYIEPEELDDPSDAPAPVLVALPQKQLRIAMVGTRGVPAAYGGFETAVEEIGSRLAARGHEVTVYCRPKDGNRPAEHLGMKLVHLPALKKKTLETLSHSALSALHMLGHRKQDMAFVFNAANSPFVPIIKARRVPTAVHVDGLEWRRGKWGKWGRRYYRMAEQFSVRSADALISDAQGIADYYSAEFGVPTELIAYGSSKLTEVATDKLTKHGLVPGEFHLVVARFEPENHVDVIVDGYTRSGSKYPLVVVGSAPYAAEYTDRIARTAAADSRIKMLGGVWDQEELNQLYAHARTYLHGHSVGGTNPSLLRAMGAGTAVIAYDVVFNREVAGPDGLYFADADALVPILERIEDAGWKHVAIGTAMQQRAEAMYDWDKVALGYEELAMRLVAGETIHGLSKGRRRKEGWNETAAAILPDERPATAPLPTR
ncbi:glycosyltransferase [Naasia aerilata]|uniref:Glycosyl transferase n=1 Tax=Naasia aerilata TaxID=1162966 RepID=A0ABM8GCH9_9MICO|nr:glycosyl transferase [Naasia aerilata]